MLWPSKSPKRAIESCKEQEIARGVLENNNKNDNLLLPQAGINGHHVAHGGVIRRGRMGQSVSAVFRMFVVF